jgi:hypothetical protein
MVKLLKWFDDRKDDIERGVSAAVAQVNIADNGRTYRTVMDRGRNYAPKAPSSVVSQVAPIGKALVRSPAQMLNTAAAQVPQADYSMRQAIAAATNNPAAYRNASRNLEAANDVF